MKKQKRKIDFYRCKEFFIESGNCKLLLNYRYMLFVINMNFQVLVFWLLLDSLT